MKMGPDIVTDGLQFYVDASNDKSYVSGSNSTTWKDLKRQSDVTLLNTPIYSTSNQGSIVFDGEDDYATFANILNTSTNSVCAWVYNTSTADATIIGNWSPQYIMYMDTGDAGDGYRVLIRTGLGTKGTSADNVNFIQNQWQYIVTTFSPTSLSLYVDGAHIETNTFTSTTIDSDSQNFALGADNLEGGRHFTGKIANVSIYNKTLSAAEVLQNYNAVKSRFGL